MDIGNLRKLKRFEKYDVPSVYEPVPDHCDISASKEAASTNTYNQNILTKSQQKELDKLKSTAIRNNYVYLKRHPEIKAIIFLLLHKILRCRPMTNVIGFIGEFFETPYIELEMQVSKYLEKKKIKYYSTLESSSSSVCSADIERQRQESGLLKEVLSHGWTSFMTHRLLDDDVKTGEDIGKEIEENEEMEDDDAYSISRGIVEELLQGIFEFN